MYSERTTREVLTQPNSLVGIFTFTLRTAHTEGLIIFEAFTYFLFRITGNFNGGAKNADNLYTYTAYF